MANSHETLGLVVFFPYLLCCSVRYENEVNLPDFCMVQDV